MRQSQSAEHALAGCIVNYMAHEKLQSFFYVTTYITEKKPPSARIGDNG